MKIGRLVLLGLLVFAGGACSNGREELAQELTGGNVARGKAAFRKYGCGSCHEVHNEHTARGSVGPSFHDFAKQSYLPGGLINAPATLVRWIQHPREVEPRTAMPDLGVSEADARDLAAYLYTML